MKSTSRCSRLLTDALIDDKRRPQVVRHRGEQRGAQLVGLCETLRRGGVGPQRALLHRDRHLPGERLEHLEVVGPEVGAADDQHVVARERDREVGVRRARRGTVGPDARDARSSREPDARDSTADRLGLERRPAPARRAAGADPPPPTACR